MPRNRDVNIQPGSAFHLPAAQSKNVDNLLAIFNKKEATDALTAMGKMDKETWGSVKETVNGLKDFVIGGGISAIKDEIRQIVKDEAMGIFSPILNEFQPIIADLWEAFEPIMPFLVDAVTWIVNILKPVITFIADGIVAIIEFLTGGSTLGAMLPGLFGDIVDVFQTPEEFPDQTPGGQYGGRIGRILDDPYGDY